MTREAIAAPAEDRKTRADLKRRWFRVALAAMGFAALWGLVLMQSHHRAIVIDVSSPQAGEIQVFSDQGHGLSEALSVTRPLAEGRNTLLFPLFDGETKLLRIDPSPGIPSIIIHSISVASIPRPVLRPGTEQRIAPSVLKPSHEVAAVEPAGTGAQRFVMVPEAADPRILYTPDQPIGSGSRPGSLPRFWLWGSFLLACLGLFVTGRQSPKLPLVPIATLVAGLILSMAIASQQTRSTHPDEFLHIADAEYFVDHWLPPRLDAEDLTPSLRTSVYGVSYLFEWNFVYLAAGKTARVLAFSGIEPVVAYRLFNVGLFALLIGALCALRMPSLGFLALLATPQAWYVFSYLNGDALPFALSCIAVAIAAQKNGGLQTFLEGGKPDWRTVVFVVAVGLLLISKRNYWPVIGFLFIYLSCARLGLSKWHSLAAVSGMLVLVTVSIAGDRLREAYGMSFTSSTGVVAAVCAALLIRWSYRAVLRVPERRQTAIRLGVCLAAALIVASPWIVTDALRNGMGSKKSELVTELRNLHAAPQFKPSTLAETPELSRKGLALAEKGTGLDEILFEPFHWVRQTYRSFFGVYGYMRYYGSGILYAAFGLALVGAAITAGLAGIRAGLITGGQLVAIAGSAATIVFASLLHSWTYDFQPQGRYVLGLLPLLIPLFISAPQEGRSGRVFAALAVCTVALGIYSFTRVGLTNLV